MAGEHRIRIGRHPFLDDRVIERCPLQGQPLRTARNLDDRQALVGELEQDPRPIVFRADELADVVTRDDPPELISDIGGIDTLALLPDPDREDVWIRQGGGDERDACRVDERLRRRRRHARRLDLALGRPQASQAPVGSATERVEVHWPSRNRRNSCSSVEADGGGEVLLMQERPERRVGLAPYLRVRVIGLGVGRLPAPEEERGIVDLAGGIFFRAGTAGTRASHAPIPGADADDHRLGPGPRPRLIAFHKRSFGWTATSSKTTNSVRGRAGGRPRRRAPGGRCRWRGSPPSA